MSHDEPGTPDPQAIYAGVPGEPTAEILDAGGSAAPPPVGGNVFPADQGSSGGRRRWPIVAAVTAVLAVGGAGIALGMAFSGGGTQPEVVVPASALAFADIDFDPDAGQKVNLVRLLNKFPAIEEELGGRTDIKEYLVEQILSSEQDWSADDVSSWLGDRAGVAVLWDDETAQPIVVGVVAVTDEEAAGTALRQHLEDGQWTFDQGYAVITSGTTGGDTGAVSADEVVAMTAEAPLADDPDFVAAMAPLGSGLASMYMDGDRVTEVLDQSLPGFVTGELGAFGSASDTLTGKVALVLRAEPSAIELVGGSSTVLEGVSTTPTELFASLPDSTGLALAVTGGGDSVTKQWEAFRDQVDQLSHMEDFSGVATASLTDRQPSEFDRAIAELEARYNIRLPEDLVTLLGDDMVVAVDGDGLMSATPGVGLRSITDPAAAADLADRLQPVVDDLTAGYGVTISPTDDGLVIGSTSEYATELMSGAGDLGAQPNVIDALPDADQASTILWVDLETMGDLAGMTEPQLADVLGPLAGLGVTAGADDDGAFFRARLTFDE